MNKATKRNFSKLINQMKKLNLDSSNRYVIYPYGREGKRVKAVLNYLGIKESFIIDNKLCKEDTNIKHVDELNKIDVNEFIFLFSCRTPRYYNELLREIKKVVPDRRIIEIFPAPVKMIYILKSWRHKNHFLWTIKNTKGIRVMDVGCGNASAQLVKAVDPNIFYTGIDVGDYNQTTSSLNLIDDYHVVTPEKFGDEIAYFNGTEDYVISSHNIEHCNNPEKVITAMCRALKQEGVLYMSFPSRESVLFPSRGGTLNFYDDTTHIYLPDFEGIIKILKECGMKILFKRESMRGWYLKRIGKENEPLSIAENRVLNGTWDYWGFESIIWAKKIRPVF